MKAYIYRDIFIMQKLIQKEIKYCANIYKSLPVVVNKGKGVFVHDVNGKKYFDYISGYCCKPWTLSS